VAPTSRESRILFFYSRLVFSFLLIDLLELGVLGVVRVLLLFVFCFWLGTGCTVRKGFFGGFFSARGGLGFRAAHPACRKLALTRSWRPAPAG